MSTVHDAHAKDTRGAHHAHAFDAEPVRALSAGEPRTPAWLPILGLLLFVATGIWFVAGAEASPAAPAKPSESQAVAAPPAPQPPPAVRPPAAQPQQPGAVPAAPPTGTFRKLSPEQMNMLRKRIEERQKQGAPAPKPAQP